MKTVCFAAGPAKMDPKAKKKLCELIEKDPSIVELSHRSETFQKILMQTKQTLRSLFDVPNDMEILFLSGGASFQFLQCAQNLLHHKAAYLVTGLFSKLAYEAAQHYGKCDLLYDNHDHPYELNDFPETIKGDYDYVYLCVNNSLYGTRTPDVICDCPVVADVSSCLGIEKLDFSRYALAFASAQKNFGISGMTIVFVKRELNFRNDCPQLLSYPHLMEHDSLINTPPVLSIAACGLCAEELLKRKETLYEENRKKADCLYNLLDQSAIFFPLVKKQRSLMNVPCFMESEEAEQVFLKQCEKKRIFGIKGHRTTGHLRISVNAHVSLQEVKILISIMKDFEQSWQKEKNHHIRPKIDKGFSL